MLVQLEAFNWFLDIHITNFTGLFISFPLNTRLLIFILFNYILYSFLNITFIVDRIFCKSFSLSANTTMLSSNRIIYLNFHLEIFIPIWISSLLVDIDLISMAIKSILVLHLFLISVSSCLFYDVLILFSL